MDIQLLIVSFILLAAVIFAVRSVYKKTRALGAKENCSSECGCSADTDTIN